MLGLDGVLGLDGGGALGDGVLWMDVPFGALGDGVPSEPEADVPSGLEADASLGPEADAASEAEAGPPAGEPSTPMVTRPTMSTRTAARPAIARMP